MNELKLSDNFYISEITLLLENTEVWKNSKIIAISLNKVSHLTKQLVLRELSFRFQEKLNLIIWEYV